MTRVTGPNGLTFDLPDVVAQGLLKNKNDFKDVGPVIFGDGRTPADTPVPEPTYLSPTGTNPAGVLNDGGFTSDGEKGLDAPLLDDDARERIENEATESDTSVPAGNASKQAWSDYADSRGIDVPEDATRDDIKELVSTHDGK